MKSRSPDRNKVVSELDALNAQLDEVRTEARRLAAIRVATERKLEDIGKNLDALKAHLGKSGLVRSRGKK